MRRLVLTATIAVAAMVFMWPGAGRARAEVVVHIDKSKQRMTVLLDGAEKYTWLISTGLGGGPPSGSYRPQRFERKWHSRKYDWAPMPYSIFFHEGYAIHGTIHVSRLGNRASKGCVRLHPDKAAILFSLVQSQSVGATRIVVASTGVAESRRESAAPIPASTVSTAAPESAGTEREAMTPVPQAESKVPAVRKRAVFKRRAPPPEDDDD
jgi:hypothetical protein